MAINRRDLTKLIALAGLAGAIPYHVSSAAAAADPLPSWNDGAAKQAILDFVARTTTPGSSGFVQPGERIAVFDNDGTLWCEQPVYTQFTFAIDRIKAMANSHPEWQTTEPFRSVLAGDMKGVLAGGEQAVAKLIAASHAGNTTAEFHQTVAEWIATAKHPRFDRPYTECIYQPMLEVLAFLRANGFETWIVSGGGIEFMRPWAEKAYGIPPQQIVGSSIRTSYEVRDGKPAIVRLPEVEFVDDKAGKPVGISRFIGRRPVAAFGNSDGDYEMLEWTTRGQPGHLGMIVHHDDKAREYAYDRDSHIGKLDRGLDDAGKQGWTIISMKSDWRRIFPGDP
jgi:phosphoglycolate phosphatase-like HAD superfamily hydrolase